MPTFSATTMRAHVKIGEMETLDGWKDYLLLLGLSYTIELHVITHFVRIQEYPFEIIKDFALITLFSKVDLVLRPGEEIVADS